MSPTRMGDVVLWSFLIYFAFRFSQVFLLPDTKLPVWNGISQLQVPAVYVLAQRATAGWNPQCPVFVGDNTTPPQGHRGQYETLGCEAEAGSLGSHWNKRASGETTV